MNRIFSSTILPFAELIIPKRTSVPKAALPAALVAPVGRRPWPPRRRGEAAIATTVLGSPKRDGGIAWKRWKLSISLRDIAGCNREYR